MSSDQNDISSHQKSTPSMNMELNVRRDNLRVDDNNDRMTMSRQSPDLLNTGTMLHFEWTLDNVVGLEL